MFPPLAAVTRALIIANVAMFGLQLLVGDLTVNYLALWPWHSASAGAPPFQIWQVVSYGFMHDPRNLSHLLFNMLALYMFGSDIERSMGTNRYLTYYFTSVVGAALTQLVVQALLHSPPQPTLGASGGVFGILLAYGIAFPERRIMMIFPPIPMPARVFVAMYGLFELALGVTGTQQGVAHFAHLGGMIGGYALILYWRHGSRR
jgi:membrane associated rhomboid family serine protease